MNGNQPSLFRALFLCLTMFAATALAQQVVPNSSETNGEPSAKVAEAEQESPGVVRLRAKPPQQESDQSNVTQAAYAVPAQDQSFFYTLPQQPQSANQPWISPASFQPSPAPAESQAVNQNGFGQPGNVVSGMRIVPPRRASGPAPVYGLEQRFGEILGTERPETAANIFIPLLYDGDNSIFFGDGRVYVTTSGRTGGSLGFGLNTYDEFLDRIFGISGWWDYDDGNARSYQQLGFNVNSIGRWFEWNLNGYLPYSTDQYRIANFVDTSNPRFMGNNVVFDRFEVFETAFRGVDAEVGGPLPLLGRYGWSGHVGGYFYSSNDDQDAGGVKVRFSANVSQDLTMGIEVTNDRLFGTNVFLSTRLTFPDFRGWRWFRPRSVKERMMTSVQRRYRAITFQRTVNSTTPAINADDNQPFLIAFIDPLQAGSSDEGTFENRFTSIASFNSLTEAQRREFDVLIVGPGTEPSAPVTGLIGGLTLFDNQRLLNQNASIAFNTTLGTFTLGAVSPGSAVPILSNASAGATGAVVTIAGSNVEVDGFTIDGSTGAPSVLTNGILVADGITASDVTIENNTIQNTLNGIFTLPNGGFSTTVNSSFGQNLVIQNNTFTGNVNTIASSGINITTTAGFNINNNSISGFREGAVIRNTGTGTGIFSNNTLIASADISMGNPASNRGLFLTHASTGTLSLLVSSNIATGFQGTTAPQFNEDTNNNGILDTVPTTEDVNGNGFLDIPSGFMVVADGATINANDIANTTQQLGFINNTATGNGTGLSLNAINGGTLNAAVEGNFFNNNVDNFTGFNAKARGDGSVVNIGSFNNNQVVGNSGNGIFLAAVNGGMLLMNRTEDRNANGVLDGSEDANGNGLLDAGEDTNGNGMLDASEDVNGNGVLDLGFVNNVVSANGSSTDATAVLNGISVLSTGTGAVSGAASLARVQIGGGGIGQANAILNNGNGTAGGRGIVFNAQNGGQMTATLVQATVTGSGLDGVLATSDGTNSRINLAIGQRNDLTNPFSPQTLGVNLSNNGLAADVAGATATPGNAVTIQTSNNGSVLGSIVNANLTNPASAQPGFDTGDNIRIEATTGTVDFSTEDANGNNILDAGEDRNGNGILDLGIVDNLMVRAANIGGMLGNSGGVNGLFIDATDADVSATIRGNTINDGNATILNSAGAGIRVESDGTGTPTLNLTIGGSGTGDGNNIDDNSIVGVGIVLAGNTMSNLRIAGNQITNTVGSDATFAGGGIEIELSDNAQLLTGSQIDANLIGVTGGGANDPNVRGIDINATDASIVNLLIGNETNGDNDDGNTISNHATLPGIAITRNNTAFIQDVRIIDNTLTNNSQGIDLNSIGSMNTTSDNFTINFNTITSSTSTTEAALSASIQTDATVNLNVLSNNISNNAHDGIELTEIAVTTSPRQFTGSIVSNTVNSNGGAGIIVAANVDNFVIGSADGNNATLANTISMNALDGVEISGSGVSTNPITDAALTLGDNTISMNMTGGIDIDLDTTGTLVEFHSIALLNNTITQNTGDGLEILSDSPSLASSTTPGLTVVADRNMITANTGRGVDILNQGNNVLTDIRLTNNDISTNTLEGVYVVNTASTTQNQTAASSVALAADGAVTNDARLSLTMDNNMVTGNGTAATLSGSGLVLRIGTMDSDSGAAAITNDGGFATDGSGNFQRGGVFATITNNAFTGNGGDEVLIESFVSTVNPIDTVGTWNATTFTVTAFQQDPLARLDLIFTGNTGSTIDIVRPGASYNNVEDEFKSRDTGQTPAGPFGVGGTRLRNAQRLANRMAPFDAPIGLPDNGMFLYPGVGGSTFRRSTASNVSGFTGGDDFISTVPLGAGFGELDFLWGSF